MLIFCILALFLTIYAKNIFNYNITEKDFVSYVDNRESALIYFWQESCGSCQSLRPLVEEASRELNKKILFLNADTVNEDFWNQWNISYVPSIIKIDAGDVNIFDTLSTKKDVIDILNGTCSNSSIDRPTSITDLTYDEVITKMQDGNDFVLYVGRPDCKDCNMFYPLLDEYVSESAKGLYYFNIKLIRDQSDSKDNSENDKYKKFVETFNLQWVPSIYHIRSGEILSKFEYLSSDYYKLDSDEDKEEMKNNYYDMFINWMETVQ